MKTIKLILAVTIIALIVSCKGDKKKVEETITDTVQEVKDQEIKDIVEKKTERKKVNVVLEAKSGSKLSGNVIFIEENGNVSLTALISGLSEGLHAIHIHETPDCSSADGKSAGGHWNPTFQPHGKWGDEKGYHKGDIGNFKTDANGNGTLNMITDQWCIGCGDQKKDIIGKAIIVHDGIDDFTSQPSGAAGKRVGCGVIKI